MTIDANRLVDTERGLLDRRIFIEPEIYEAEPISRLTNSARCCPKCCPEALGKLCVAPNLSLNH